MDTPQDFSAEPCTPEQVIPDQNLSAAGQDLSAAGHRISGIRFDGEIYRMKVGSKARIFSIHQSILEESPVLKRMIHGGFAESISKEISLPEDDEDAFGRIIEYLYGDHQNAFLFSGLDHSETLKKLATIYIVADKYNLAAIQKVVISALEKVSKADMTAFFKTGCHISQNVQPSDKIFSTYFEKKAREHLKTATTAATRQISDLVESGGSFAKAVFQVQADLYQEEQLMFSTKQCTFSAEKIWLKNQLTSKEELLEKAQADISKLRNKLFQLTGKRERLR